MLVDISVIIPTMNRPESLKQTLESIAKCKICPSEIIIVDQSQNTEIAKINREVLNLISNRTNVKYLYQDTPSLTCARNFGIRNAVNDIIVCSDDDVDVLANTFNKIAEVMSDKTIAMIAGLDTNTVLAEGNRGGVLLWDKVVSEEKNWSCN